MTRQIRPFTLSAMYSEPSGACDAVGARHCVVLPHDRSLTGEPVGEDLTLAGGVPAANGWNVTL